MKKQSHEVARINALLDRLSRLIALDGWEGNLNPAQMAALSYLGRANRFSRSPSVVAEYLGATRGTVSQTLKALHRKGLVEESSNPTDKRSISYKLTPEGDALLAQRRLLDNVLDGLPDKDRAALDAKLGQVVGSALEALGLKLFGACKTCKYHKSDGAQRYCMLLDVPLHAEEADQICVEQTR